MGLVKNVLAIVARLFKAYTSSKSRVESEVAPIERKEVYELLHNYYFNQVYNRGEYGGSLDYVNELLGEAAARDLAPYINPIEQVIELYAQNTFRGNFGDEITIAEKVGTKRNSRPVNEKILDPLEQIWEWSNINGEKDRYARIASLYGTAGIRVVARVGADYPFDAIADRRVYLQFEHPGVIEDYVEDARSNVTQILTEHRIQEGDLNIKKDESTRDWHIYRMLMNKTRFETIRDDKPYNNTGITRRSIDDGYRYNDAQETTESDENSFATYDNIYGFVPYVLAFFRKHEGKWGAWSFAGSEQLIDRINALCSHINRQIHRHVNATWMVTTSGDEPEEFHFGGNRVLLITRNPEQTADTTVEPLIANLSLSEAIEQLKFLVTILADKLPELKAVMGEYLSNQSGETIAQLRKPAEDKLQAFRANCEASLIKAQKMALSVGIVLGCWDVGTGQGTVEAANAAYRGKLLDHRFNDRPALSVTRLEELEIKQLEQEVGYNEATGEYTKPEDELTELSDNQPPRQLNAPPTDNEEL